MKRTVKALVFIIMALTFVLTAYAGSIPEDLLNYDNAKLYIGKIENFTEEKIQSAPYVKVTSAAVMPTKKIKGNVELGNLILYNNNDIYTKLEVGKEYLIADFDENNIYAYDIKSEIDEKIYLADSDKYDMIARLEQYINDGSYKIAELERLDIGNQKSLATFLGNDMDKSKKIVFSFNNNQFEVDKNKFIELANSINITNIKDKTIQDTNYGEVLYIRCVNADSSIKGHAYCAITPNGEVDKNTPAMSRLIMADYKMEADDIEKLYSLFPQNLKDEIPVLSTDSGVVHNDTKDVIVPWVVSLAVLIIAVAIIVFALKRKKHN